MAEALDQAEAFARIRLLRSPHIGSVGYVQLLMRFGSAVEALAVLPEMGSRGGRGDRAAPIKTIEREIEAVRRAGTRYLFHDQSGYPATARPARQRSANPDWCGDLALAAQPCVAMVGARKASAAAVKLARNFAAHEEAFPRTVGVIASGIDIAYPPQHAALQERIASEGLLFAEQPPGTEPRGSHFPSRNRIIAGLAARTRAAMATTTSFAKTRCWCRRPKT